MGKAQVGQNFATATNQNATNNANSQTSYNAAQNDVNSFSNELAYFKSQNPYVQGGQFQTSQNQQLADTAAAGAQSTAQAIQGAGVRSGQNPSAGIAAAEQVSQANQRDMTTDEAGANQDRMKGLTSYNADVLSATAKPEEMESNLFAKSGELAQDDLKIGAEDAAATKSFGQELGQSYAESLGKGLGETTTDSLQGSRRNDN